MKAFSPKGLSQIARRLYPEGPGFLRGLQIYRPYICPFGPLIEAVPQDARILDIGCGGGLFLGLLAHFGRISSGLGFDSSAAAIGLAERMKDGHPEGGRLAFQCGSGGNSLPDERFDAVSMIDLMHHVPRDRQPMVFGEAAQRVRPGGILLYKDVVDRPLWWALPSKVHDLVFAGQWIHIPSYDSVAGWAGKAGLSETGRSRFNVLWYGHEMAVFRRPEE